mmetsp:Transcript_8924/g.20855  ORF Transcript_8924/g.20855 Transcript_8924/m.20855 type:complete len:247 (-) Transcript_8924:1059-1799(-)
MSRKANVLPLPKAAMISSCVFSTRCWSSSSSGFSCDFSLARLSSKLDINIAKKRFNITKFPKTITTTKKNKYGHPTALMPLYMTSFQFSPVRIWKTVMHAHKKLSKCALGTHTGRMSPGSKGGGAQRAFLSASGTKRPVLGSNIICPPKKLCPTKAKTMMTKQSNKTKSLICSSVSTMAFINTLMLGTRFASLKILSSLKARNEEKNEPPKKSKTERSTMMPSKRSAASDQYLCGPSATCKTMNSK